MIVMVTVDVLEHVAAVVYVTVYVPGVDVEGVIPPVPVFNVKPLGALKTPPASVIVGVKIGRAHV